MLSVSPKKPKSRYFTTKQHWTFLSMMMMILQLWYHTTARTTNVWLRERKLYQLEWFTAKIASKSHESWRLRKVRLTLASVFPTTFQSLIEQSDSVWEKIWKNKNEKRRKNSARQSEESLCSENISTIRRAQRTTSAAANSRLVSARA